MKEWCVKEKKLGMYMVVVDIEKFPLTFDDDGRYVITRDTYSQLVKVTNWEFFDRYIQDLCKKPGAKVSYYFLSKLEDILDL
mgnify:FL=1